MRTSKLTYPSHFLVRETEAQRGKGMAPKVPRRVCGTFLPPASLHRILAPKGHSFIHLMARHWTPTNTVCKAEARVGRREQCVSTSWSLHTCGENQNFWSHSNCNL